MLVIIDYGLGNLGSVANMLRRTGAEARISDKPEQIAAASALILPGVGAFDNGMKNLHERGLVELLTERVVSARTPILGICLGMQLFTSRSEEGERAGLGWLEAETRKFAFGPDAAGRLAIPHMGWNETKAHDAVLFKDLDAPGTRFYFVHSYHVVCAQPADVAATCDYGTSFTAAVHRGNIYGTQFHPEKSHRFGLKVLQNFVEAARGA